MLVNGIFIQFFFQDVVKSEIMLGGIEDLHNYLKVLEVYCLVLLGLQPTGICEMTYERCEVINWRGQHTLS